MKITAIEPQKNHPERVNVHVDGAFRLALAAELAWSARLHIGDEVTEERLTELEREDQGWKARESAFNLLSFRPRSAAELEQRLRRKGFEPEVAEGTVERLADLGMVDDAAFAETFARDRVRLRPQGKRRLRQELRAKGVDPETAEAAIEGAMEREETDEPELARQAAAKWRRRAGEDDQSARRRLYGYLARRGFDSETIMAVVDDLIGR